MAATIHPIRPRKPNRRRDSLPAHAPLPAPAETDELAVLMKDPVWRDMFREAWDECFPGLPPLAPAS
jgi:hypothetical protein